MTYPNAQPAPSLDAGRLWAGGAATAVVAALIAVVGVLIAAGVFGLTLLGPPQVVGWWDTLTGNWAIFAALAALVATAILHVLLISTPRPMAFFRWIVGLATVAAVAWPFAAGIPTSGAIASAIINAVIGIAILSILSRIAVMAYNGG
jgi:hypothetical protein